MSDIDARIAAALSTPTPSAEIAVVLDDAYTALRSAKAVSAKAQRDALDPLTPAAEVAAARQRAERKFHNDAANDRCRRSEFEIRGDAAG